MSDEQDIQARAARGWRLWLVFLLLVLIGLAISGENVDPQYAGAGFS